MEVKAVLKYLRISARKVRLVANLIKGLKIKNAENQLSLLPQKSVSPILKLLKSAKANAVNNFHLSPDNLFVSLVKVDEGPILKRFRARARGSAAPIRKRSSHITLILKELKKKESVIKEKGAKEEVISTKPQDKVEKRIPENNQNKIKNISQKKFGQPLKSIKESQTLSKQKVFRRKSI